MFEDVLGGLCVCWLLPMALLCGVVLVSHAIGVAWRDRGLERGAVYCSGCRFNLKGCASWNCPECGAHLDEGRVMTPGQDRPVGVVARVLLVASAAVGPLVAAGVLLALVVPVNYHVSRTLRLVQAGDSQEVTLYGSYQASWLGRETPESLLLWVPPIQSRSPGSGFYAEDQNIPVPLGKTDNDVISDMQWEQIVQVCGFGEESEVWRESARQELVVAVRYMANEGALERDTSQWQTSESRWSGFEPDPVFVLVEFLLGLVALGLVVRWAVRWHGRVMDVHEHRHARLAEKVNGWISNNREKAGLDGGGRGGTRG